MTSLVVRGGEVLSPHGWGVFDVLLAGTRIVSGPAVVRTGGETVDGAGGQPEESTGGAGAARVALTEAVEGEAVAAARPDNLAAGGAPAVPVLDASGLRVVPGFVDLQCNGGFGIDLSSEPERLWELAARLPPTGVTAWLPTIVTGPPDVRRRALATLRAGPPDDLADAPLATPLGLHLEGPFLAPGRRGAHPEAWLRPVPVPRGDGDGDVGDFGGWSRDAGVRLVTLAPELPGALDLVRALVDRGVVASAGHSSATAAEAEAAIDAGARYVTHLFNAMSPLHHREPGLAGVALTDARVRVGVIADGVHLHPRVVRLAARALGHRLSLVTDAVAALGVGPGPVRVGRLGAVAGPDGVRLPNGSLAGSTLSLDGAVRNARRMAGLDLAAAVRAATAVPAAVLGLADRGVIAPGAVGDLVALDADDRVVATVIGGRVAHDRRRPTPVLSSPSPP